jgi:hypothetical protein
MANRDTPRKHTSPFCVNEFHDRCPGLCRAHRTTPQGKELKELLCACRCHKEP